jgi:hypothetical protein
VSVNQKLPTVEECVKRKLMKKAVGDDDDVGCIHLGDQRTPEKVVKLLQV